MDNSESKSTSSKIIFPFFEWVVVVGGGEVNGFSEGRSPSPPHLSNTCLQMETIKLMEMFARPLINSWLMATPSNLKAQPNMSVSAWNLCSPRSFGRLERMKPDPTKWSPSLLSTFSSSPPPAAIHHSNSRPLNGEICISLRTMTKSVNI